MSRREGSHPLRPADFLARDLLRVAASAVLVSSLGAVGCRRDAIDGASAPPAPAPAAPPAPRLPRGPDPDALPPAPGIPPTLSVLRDRFLADAARACDPTLDVSKLLAVDSIETWGATSEQKELAKFHAREQRLEAARAKANAPNLEALAEMDRRYAKD